MQELFIPYPSPPKSYSIQIILLYVHCTPAVPLQFLEQCGEKLVWLYSSSLLTFSKNYQKSIISDFAFSATLNFFRTFCYWDAIHFNHVPWSFRSEYFHSVQKESYSCKFKCSENSE